MGVINQYKGGKMSLYYCENCGGILKYKIHNRTQGWYYINCEWCFITSYFEDYIIDDTVYSIYNANNKNINISQIKTISIATSTNFIQAKKILDMDNIILFKGKAREIDQKIIMLSKAKISYYTIPKYPYHSK